MGGKSKWDYFREIFWRYREGAKGAKGRILDEFCGVCRYSRKYAIRKLSGPPPGRRPERRLRRRRAIYGPQVISILHEVWEAAGYPWSVRLTRPDGRVPIQVGGAALPVLIEGL